MAQVARKFIRHPVEIPIEVRADDQPIAVPRQGYNLSLGGLALRSPQRFARGDVVELSIEFVQPPFQTKARVAWCRSHDQSFELGVEFLDPEDAFRARMVEQVCHIEHYKREVNTREGRDLTTDEAAVEWIGKYAANFPGPGREDGH